MSERQSAPWEGLDPHLARALEPELPAVAEEIIAAIAAGVPGYRRPMGGAFGRGVRTAIEEALGQFVDLVGESAAPGRPPAAPRRRTYEALGRGELRAGRSLDALQAAYRLGARVAWRRVSAAAARAGASTEQIALLAEAVFAYIDEISALSVEGYARAQAERAGERQRSRERLVRLLVEGDAEVLATAGRAAAEAEWPLPRTLAVLLAAEDDHRRLASRLGADALAARVGGHACVLVPDPQGPGRAAAIAAAAGQLDAALGPTVAPERAALSHERALAALRLRAQGVVAAEGLLVCDRLRAELIVHRDPLLRAELRAERLRALEGETPASRLRLERTLRAWLDHQGSLSGAAAALGVHVGTVRYRISRVRALLGAELDDPRVRFELVLVLDPLDDDASTIYRDGPQ